MSKLIDADALIEELKKHYIGVYRLDTLVRRYIDEQPTAYYVDAVVEEIKKHSYFMGIRESMVETIVRIVRKGGTNER